MLTDNHTHTVSAIDYYNEVAESYNNRQTASDLMEREKVSRLFIQKVLNGKVLDFGGGTGLDLCWLIRSGYHIYFLEPSVNMRKVAKQTPIFPGNENQINFIDSNTDFYVWTHENLPFYEKMDGVLINFAVLNSIGNLHLFFRKIRMICKENCYLIISLLDARPHTILKKYGLSHFARQIIGGKSVCYVHFKGLAHKTFIYSLPYLRNRSRPYFNCVSCQYDGLSGFMTVILSAK